MSEKIVQLNEEVIPKRSSHTVLTLRCKTNFH